MEKPKLKELESHTNLDKKPVEIPHMVRLTYHDYYNARQRHIKNIFQLRPKYYQSFQKC